MRQDTFISHVDTLGWTSPTFISSDHSLVANSLHAYHKFLDIAVKNSGTTLVPTILIDSAWHTHQLSGDKYRLDVVKLLGRFLNHDDKVEEGVLCEFVTSILVQSSPCCVRQRVSRHCGCMEGTSASIRTAFLLVHGFVL